MSKKKKKSITRTNKQVGLLGLMFAAMFVIAMFPVILLFTPLIVLGLINNKG